MPTPVESSDISTVIDNDLLFRRLVEHMNEAVWVIDRDQKTLYVNPQFCRLMGFSFDEILGVNAYDFLDEVSKKWVMRIDEVERSRGISSTYEVVLISKSGEQIPVLISGAPLSEGKTIAIITDLRGRSWRNISSILLRDDLNVEPAHPLGAGLSQEFLFQRLVENMNEAVWVTDTN